MRRGGQYRNSRVVGHGYRYGSYSRNSYYFGLTYPWSWYWGNYGPYAYGSYGYGHPYGYGGGYGGDYYGRANAGALDLDIKPEEASIFIDGNLVGIADNYDGFPRYLWLEAGTHNVVIYHEGYETLAKQIKLGAGVVLRLKDEMVPGTAKSADEMYAQLAPLPRERGRVREDRDDYDNREEAPLAPWRFKDRSADADDSLDDPDQSDRAEMRAPRSEPSENQSARRSPRSREQWRQRGGTGSSDGSSNAAESVPPIATDLRSEASKVFFDVEPSDAVLYVDGRFVGTAQALAERGGKLLVDAGQHVVEVTRPGYKNERKEFNVEPGATETVRIELRKNE